MNADARARSFTFQIAQASVDPQAGASQSPWPDPRCRQRPAGRDSLGPCI